ncbi:Ribonuclease 3 [Giardia muris]|uniref:Ribonuclease 3 n=1 Tax=Giardia muris TaxID=5742 RepID=A0A4Z1SL99_GIAMU|nr:Ribonuclease 3 [Giardia muris]|eukprot:TNJ26412.1 Ribonuclease 3 [Giardia muris]
MTWIDQLFDELAAAGAGPGVGIMAEEWMDRFPFTDNMLSGFIRQVERDEALNAVLASGEMTSLCSPSESLSSIRFRGELLGLSSKVLIFSKNRELAKKAYKILCLLRRVKAGDLSASDFGKLVFKATRTTDSRKAYFEIFMHIPTIIRTGQLVLWDDFSTLADTHALQPSNYLALSERILVDTSRLRCYKEPDLRKIPLDWSVNKRKTYALHARLSNMLRDGMGRSPDSYSSTKFLNLCKDHPYLGLRFVDGLLPKNITELLKEEFGGCNCDRLSFTIPAKPDKIKEFIDNPFRLIKQIQVHIPGQELDSTLRRIHSAQALQNIKENNGSLVSSPLREVEAYNPPQIRPPNLYVEENDEQRFESDSESDLESEDEVEDYCTLPPKLGFFRKVRRSYAFISRKLLWDNRNTFFHSIPDVANTYDSCISVQKPNGLYHATVFFLGRTFEATAGGKRDSRTECMKKVFEFLYENFPEAYLRYLPVHLMVSIDLKGDVRYLVEKALGLLQPSELSSTLSEDEETLITMFEDHIGYHFKDRELLRRAVTETQFSCASLSYERLEFLGDSLLQKVSGELLYERFADPEIHGPGWLTVARSSLVDNRTLAFIAVLIGIPRFLGNPTIKTCGDVVEAVIGAIWKDASEHEAVRVIKRLWSLYFSNGLLTDLEVGRDVVMDRGNAFWALEAEGKRRYQAAFDTYLNSLLESLASDTDADGLKEQLTETLKSYREYDRRFVFQNFARIRETYFSGSTFNYTRSSFIRCVLRAENGTRLGEGCASTKQEAEELSVASAYYRLFRTVGNEKQTLRPLTHRERELAIKDLLKCWRVEINKESQAIAYFSELETIAGKLLRTSYEVLNDGDKRARRVVTTVLYGDTKIVRGPEQYHRREANRTAKFELLEYLSKGDEEGDPIVLKYVETLSSGLLVSSRPCGE